MNKLKENKKGNEIDDIIYHEIVDIDKYVFGNKNNVLLDKMPQNSHMLHIKLILQI